MYLSTRTRYLKQWEVSGLCALDKKQLLQNMHGFVMGVLLEIDPHLNKTNPIGSSLY